jgi:hypothetical protein
MGSIRSIRNLKDPIGNKTWDLPFKAVPNHLRYHIPPPPQQLLVVSEYGEKLVYREKKIYCPKEVKRC